MGDWRNTGLVSGLMFLISSVSAQSTDNLIGSNLTVEESLVQFVNAVITFEVNGTEGVLLYVVAPLLGFYYVILNFTTMAYENFQDEIDRPSWSNTDEEIPRGMRGFAMMTSVITVLFLGSAGAALLLSASLISFVLAIFMFFGLFGTEEDQDNTDNTGNTQNGGGAQQNTQQGNGGGGLADLLNAGANLLGTGNNTLNNLNQQNQQQQANQLQESLRYFDSDFISELENAHNDLSDTENFLQDAEDAISNNKKAYDRFRKLEKRASVIKSELEDLISAASSEGAPGAATGSVTYASKPGPNLKDAFDSWYSPSNKRGPLFEVTKLEKQLERTVQDVPQSTMEDDFDKAWDKLRDNIFASAYFVHNLPFDLDDLIAEQDKRESVVQAASNMGKHSSRGDMATDVNELKTALSYVRGDLDRFNSVIKRAEKLAQGELKLDNGKVSQLSNLAKKDKQIQSHIEFLLELLTGSGSTPSPSNFSPSGNAKYDTSTVDPSIVNDLDGAYGRINSLQSEINSIEASIQSAGEHETTFYKELENLKSKIN